MIKKGTKEYFKEKFSPRTKRGSRLFYEIAYNNRQNSPFSSNKEYMKINEKVFELSDEKEFLSSQEILKRYGNDKLISVLNSYSNFGYRSEHQKRRIKSVETEKKIDNLLNTIRNKGKILLTYIYNKEEITLSISINRIDYAFWNNQVSKKYIVDEILTGKLNRFLDLSFFHKEIPRSIFEILFPGNSLVENYKTIHSVGDFLSKAKLVDLNFNSDIISEIKNVDIETSEFSFYTNNKLKKHDSYLSEFINVFNINMSENSIYIGKELNKMVNSIPTKSINLSFKRQTPPKWYRQSLNKVDKKKEKTAVRNYMLGKYDDIIISPKKRNAGNYW